MNSIIPPIQSQKVRIQMLHTMFEKIKGFSVLLEDLQPDPKNFSFNSAELRKEYAFKTLIATMLSVRSKDETTFKVVNKLWAHYSTPKALSEAPIEHIEELIKSSGTYHQKALNIKDAGRIILEKFHNIVPASRDDLMQIKGVGRKVANCVLVVSFNIPTIPVDTHVHRIANRTGWVTTKLPDETENALEIAFPKDEWMIINYTLVAFGKNICKPIRPKCELCPVESYCQKRIINSPMKKGKK